MLAYSSIENMGLIVLALGVGLWGAASGRPAVAALGATACLLHVWNHALMKGLMFFAAGSVVHGTGTRDMERLGGLMKRMPWTGAVMIVGAVAIAALPPLNGFVSKWLLYLGLAEWGLGPSPDRGLGPLLAHRPPRPRRRALGRDLRPPLRDRPARIAAKRGGRPRPRVRPGGCSGRWWSSPCLPRRGRRPATGSPPHSAVHAM